jgi:hypothetical protein
MLNSVGPHVEEVCLVEAFAVPYGQDPNHLAELKWQVRERDRVLAARFHGGVGRR